MTRPLAVAVLFVVVARSSAAVVTSDLGNTAPGISDGDQPVLVGPPFPDILTIQTGQPAPFDQGYGLEIDGIGSNFSQSWAHSYGAIIDPVLSASLTIGIYDHDSAAPGSQLSLFDLDGTDLTAALDALFESPGVGEELEYNVFTVALPGSVLASLTDGSLVVQLDLDGPGLVRPLFPLPGPNPVEEVEFNGAHLIFSTLQITTEHAEPPGGAIPEPNALSVWSLIGLTITGHGWRRRKRIS